MPKFTLIAEHEDNKKITYEFHEDYLPDVLLQMEMFLRGTGYFFDGMLDFVNDEPEDTVQHSEYYYDEERNKPLHEWTAVRRGEE